MKRSILILLVAGLMMAVAVPSAAKKPPKPPADPVHYDLTITIVGDEGVETTCDGAVRLERDDIHFQTWDGAQLNIVAGLLAWDGEGVTGCHGNDAPFEYFRITLDDRAGTVAILWIFDVTQTEVVIPVGKSGKVRTDTIREDFRMGGPYENGDFVTASWSETTEGGRHQISLTGLTGDFSFVHYSSGGHDDVEGSPLFVELENGLRSFTFDLVLTEAPPPPS